MAAPARGMHHARDGGRRTVLPEAVGQHRVPRLIALTPMSEGRSMPGAVHRIHIAWRVPAHAPWCRKVEMSEMGQTSFFAHDSADVSPGAQIGEGTKIWQHTQVREDVVIGRNCILGKAVYIDSGVRMGDNVKIQNGVSVYRGVTLGNGVFCGPHCVFTNDLHPRAINPDGTLQSAADWLEVPTTVLDGASIGANATIVCGVTIGPWAMIGAGAVVTRDVPAHGLAFGNPARLAGFVCACGVKLEPAEGAHEADEVRMRCPKCGSRIRIPQSDYARLSEKG
jgi:UDP-2-acetamido-3-amino-2,3-dideoxy-glucuronate N-acetyltransferase